MLGQPVLTPEVQKQVIDSVYSEVQTRSIDDLAAERDELLLGLIELRAKVGANLQSRPESGGAVKKRRVHMSRLTALYGGIPRRNSGTMFRAEIAKASVTTAPGQG